MQYRLLKIFSSLLVSSVLLFSSCGSTEDALFDIELQADFVVPAGLNNIETHFFILRDVPTQIQSYLNINNAMPEDIGRILANRARITGQFSNIDFRIIERVSVWAISSSDSGLRREAFFLDFVPSNQEGDLQLLSSISNVREIVLEDTFDLEIQITFRNISAAILESRIFMTFSAFAPE